MVDNKKVDFGLYRFIMGQPVGLRHEEYRKELARYVSTLTEEQKADLRERRYEILEAWADWTDDNLEILLRLGFRYGEANMLRMNRINSPGVRNVIKTRVEEIRMRERGRRR